MDTAVVGNAWPVAYASYVKQSSILSQRSRWRYRAISDMDAGCPDGFTISSLVAPGAFRLHDRIGSYALVQGLRGALTALVTLGIAGYFLHTWLI